jgi:hypothetical protein
MPPRLRSIQHALLTLWTCLSLVTALDGHDPEAHGTYFTSPNTKTAPQTYVFALNVVPETGDVFFHMSAYASIQSDITAFSWMGVGFGSEMKDAFMLIAYPSSNGTGLTISPRIGRGHSEPELLKDVVVEKIFSDDYAPVANQVHRGIMIAHGVCRNCSKWATGALDLENTRQPFIFALGTDPGKGTALQSDDLDAGLRRHSFYGSFFGDMTYAISTPEHGRVPPPNDPGAAPSGVSDTNFAYAFSTKAFDTHDDSEWVPVLHGVMMSLAFVLVFPTGALLMRLLRKMGVLFHAGVQSVGFFLVVVGFGTGVYAGKQYNRTRRLGTGHQVLGLLVFAALFVQVGLGVAQHGIYRRTKRETMLGFVHRFLGPSIIILGLVNGGLGLDLAGESSRTRSQKYRRDEIHADMQSGNSHYTIPYGVVVAVIGVLFLAILGLQMFHRRHKKYQPEQEWPGRKPTNEDDQRAYLTMDTPVSAYTPVSYEMTTWTKKGGGVE